MIFNEYLNQLLQTKNFTYEDFVTACGISELDVITSKYKTFVTEVNFTPALGRSIRKQILALRTVDTVDNDPQQGLINTAIQLYASLLAIEVFKHIDDDKVVNKLKDLMLKSEAYTASLSSYLEAVEDTTDYVALIEAFEDAKDKINHKIK